MRAGYKDIGEKTAKYVGVILDDDGDQVWQSRTVYGDSEPAIKVARTWLLDHHPSAQHLTIPERAKNDYEYGAE